MRCSDGNWSVSQPLRRSGTSTMNSERQVTVRGAPAAIDALIRTWTAQSPRFGRLISNRKQEGNATPDGRSA